MISNEAIDSLLKRNESGLQCKLDLGKAYDHLNWDFLLQVMQKMGFGEKWTRWIKWCISTMTFLVLINDTPSRFFHNSRGLRQGHSFSPYLFMIGMEALSFFIKRAVSGGFLTGCKVKERGGEGVQITHFLYANDMLIFYEASKDQLAYLSWLLIWFETIIGLRINLDKSEILLVWRVENLEELALKFGCKTGALSSSYSGLPLGASHKSMAA